MGTNDEKVIIKPKTQKLLRKLMEENPKLEEIFKKSDSFERVEADLRQWAEEKLKKKPVAYNFYKHIETGRKAFEKLEWPDYAAIRILDYLDNSAREFIDLNRRGEKVESNPFKFLYLAYKDGSGGITPYFVEDMINLFRQFEGRANRMIPSREKVLEWMDRYPSGLDERIIRIREENKKRIINKIIDKIDEGKIKDKKFFFKEGLSREEKFEEVLKWWDNHLFHLRFAVRDPDSLNEMLDNSIDPDNMKILYEAKEAGIPFFVNPYYLSLLNVNAPDFAVGSDLAIRDYVIYSKQLVNEFGHIVAWEKEDVVEPGKPNAAGWLLPSDHNIHRRYPEVAILIPDTVGRACGGLCASCQRMYGFQKGNLNFDLDKLKPHETWEEKLKRLLEYFEKDSQLRDILITGGDALMSNDKSLKKILDAVYEMALRKKEANKSRKEGEKYAEMIRVRLGTRLPVYIPQRLTEELVAILADFKEKASKIGVKQFVIQTHFESPMEVTPEAKKGINMLSKAGWTITNQLVFTAAASRRGHTAKLRKVLNDIGVLTYYTFSVKGYMENSYNFATNARAVQEQMEEKSLGFIPEEYYEEIKEFPHNATHMVENINKLRERENLPFLATDRNVLNLPGVGKSLTFRVIGITRQGRRILEFDHDTTRRHSPIINKMGRVVIIESKPIGAYLNQLSEMGMGEDISEYSSIWGYSIGETEERMPIYEYGEYPFKITDEMTNLKI
jgi:lysine 2,3-aminomutase